MATLQKIPKSRYHCIFESQNSQNSSLLSYTFCISLLINSESCHWEMIKDNGSCVGKIPQVADAGQRQRACSKTLSIRRPFQGQYHPIDEGCQLCEGATRAPDENPFDSLLLTFERKFTPNVFILDILTWRLEFLGVSRPTSLWISNRDLAGDLDVVPDYHTMYRHFFPPAIYGGGHV